MGFYNPVTLAIKQFVERIYSDDQLNPDFFDWRYRAANMPTLMAQKYQSCDFSYFIFIYLQALLGKYCWLEVLN
jgi:hypothetical protein